MKTLLYKELVYSNLAINIISMVGLSAFMMTKSYTLVPIFYLCYCMICNGAFSQYKMCAMIDLNVNRADIVKTISLSTVIKQSIFLCLMAFFASFNHLINEPPTGMLAIGITAFALIIITFAILNFVTSMLKYANHTIIYITCFICVVLIPITLVTLFSVFGEVPSLANIFNNNDVENLGAQLGLLGGSIALYCLLSLAEYSLSRKLIMKLDIDNAIV